MDKQKLPKKKNNSLKNLAMLSGIAFEMGAIIFLAAKGGHWLDDYYQTEKRLFTALTILVGLVISIWLVLHQLKRIQN